jgi:adenylyltransferase/sulfurtransferase
VLVIGAGGLGCPVLQYLFAAGVGHIGIVDDDLVSLSNLHRQVLYDEGDIGFKKVAVAGEKLSRLNQSVRLDVYDMRVLPSNVCSLLEPYDYVIDCSDNFPTRYLLNDACVLMGKTLVYGAVNRYEGQVTIFNAPLNGTRSANYRDLFPKPPVAGEVADCSEGGVLGALPGIIGSLQAMEAIKLITSIGETLIQKLLTYSLLDNRFYLISFSAESSTSNMLPHTQAELMGMDYSEICSLSSKVQVIDAIRFNRMIGNAGVELIDCRELDELPHVCEFTHKRMPFSCFKIGENDFSTGSFVLFCQSGKRSRVLAEKLGAFYGDHTRFYSLENGIVSWKEFNDRLIK